LVIGLYNGIDTRYEYFPRSRNFGRWLSRPGTPEADRMLELEAQKGPSGSIGYEDYGLNPIAGRYIEGLPSLFSSSPIDFGLAGSIGRYGYGPEGRTDLKYDFTPIQDTGSTGNAILDFINRGGLKNAISGIGTAQASEITPQSEPLDIEDYLGRSTPQDLGFIDSAPNIFTPTSITPDSGIDTSYGVANEDDVEQVKSLTEKKPLGIESLLKLLLPGRGIGSFLAGILPKDPPEVRATKDFYARNYGVNSAGSVASGIMQGYNPVSGGFLNYMTGGRYGKPMQVGLANAARQRIENIAKRKAPQTDASRAKIQELQKFAEADTINRARALNPDVYSKANKALGPGGGFSTSGSKKDSGFQSASSKPSGRGRQDY
jgi:hypothetical protein